MSIRLKLALILTLGIATAAAACSAVFLSLSQAGLKRADEERVGMLMASVSNMTDESLLARDPLMLLDYLQFLKRDRPEVAHCRILSGGVWKQIPSDSAEAAGKALELRRVERPPSPEGGPVVVEVAFSPAVLLEQQLHARAELVKDLGFAVAAVTLSGLLVCFPLGWSLTSRLVRIEAALGRIGAGDLKAEVPVSGSDEIARLAQGVNRMSHHLRELDEMKRTFVASVTHELRSPLGAIEAYIKELMADPSRWSDQERGSLERIRNNARRLGHFVTNLLDLAKIERGKLDYTPRRSDLGAIVGDTVLFFKPKAAESDITLSCEIPEGLAPLKLDPDLISHVLTNLLSNALKFTRKGGRVQVTVRRLDHAVECAVSDNGVGIRPEDIKRIFAPFERVKNPMRATGVGLGLTISKSIIEMHGGAIGLSSVHGSGSRFHFTLPLQPAAQ